MPRSTKVFKKRRGTYFQGRKPASTSDAQSSSSSPKASKCSAKEKKIPNLNDSYSSFVDNSAAVNSIMDLEILSSVFKNSVRCKMCNSGLDFSVAGKNAGLALGFTLKCLECPYKVEFSSSGYHDDSQIATVNTRFVYGMRSIGKGAEAGRMLCAVMNLPQPPTRFAPYNMRCLGATKLAYERSISTAAQEAVAENNNSDIAVAIDGTWQKRGFSSLNGVVTVTSVDTGKVLDVEVLSKHCSCRDKQHHDSNCKKNFAGASGMMEVKGASAIFRRSLTTHDVRYTTYLGDGDCKAFNQIEKEEIYGKNCPIEKLECVGHVMKRMGTRLRRLKTDMKGKLLSDGKGLSGKNRLTEAEIDQIQTYYGLAIRRNYDSVHKMKEAVMAIYMHKMSTNENPRHVFCPVGADSWCGYQKAEATGNVYNHKHSLPVAVVEAMRPIFKDLSKPELLKKCLHGKTQNPNESLHNVIWSRVPKTTFVHIETLKLGVYDAVCSFNMGNASKLEILENLGIKPGLFAIEAMKQLDREKLLRASYAFCGQSKERRREKRLKRKREEADVKKNPVKSGYSAGSF